MSPEQLLGLLDAVAAGRATPADALERLCTLPFEEVHGDGAAGVPFARLDHHRMLRVGIPEVVYGAGKSPQQLADICRTLARTGKDRKSVV